jgi:hypothetical protein
MHYRLFPQAAAMIAKGLFASPTLAPTLVGAPPPSRRGSGCGAGI